MGGDIILIYHVFTRLRISHAGHPQPTEITEIA